MEFDGPLFADIADDIRLVGSHRVVVFLWVFRGMLLGIEHDLLGFEIVVASVVLHEVEDCSLPPPLAVATDVFLDRRP